MHSSPPRPPVPILVTGGAGFIGSCLVRQLVAAGQRVLNLDKLTYAGNLDSLAPVMNSESHEFVQGDIGDRDLLKHLFEKHQPNAVIHLAAESHVDRSIDGPAEFVQTNVQGTFQLLSAALNYWRQLPSSDQATFRFVHVSTDEVYGSLGEHGKFTESTAYDPSSPYSASKAASDHFVRAYHRTYGLPTIVTNCSNNYGPYQFPEKLIPLMILNAIEGKPLPVYGDGQNVRDWLFVEDHCRAIQSVTCEGRPGETYNIGGDSERTNLEVVHAICDVLDQLRQEPGSPTHHSPLAARGSSHRDLITFVKDRPGHDRRYAIDATKIKRELGWTPSIQFEKGIRRTVQWYLDNPTWIERITSGGYRRERLGVASC